MIRPDLTVSRLMSGFSVPRLAARERRGSVHLLPIALATALGAAAVALVAYILWPTWGADGSRGPKRLPVSIGGTLFNVPPDAIRMKIQRHSGPQERIDLNFGYPSLQPPDAPKHVSADTIEQQIAQPIDRIFLSIATHQNALAPEARVENIYPRYLEQASSPGPDGLAVRAFRDSTPYAGEDLFSSATPRFNARCTREAAIPGMCLSERRIDGADLTFRFPRQWLTHWRDVAAALDELTVQLHGSK